MWRRAQGAGEYKCSQSAAAQHPRTIISEISEIGISSLQHSKKHQIDPPQLEVSKMRTVFIALGLVAATLAAPLADVQETGSLADKWLPSVAYTQQYGSGMYMYRPGGFLGFLETGQTCQARALRARIDENSR